MKIQLYNIYTHNHFWDTGLHRFHSGDFFCSYTHTFTHAHARTHYSNAHTTCEKVSLRLLPKSHQKSSQSTLVLFTPPSPCFFLLVYYFMQFKIPRSLSLQSNSPFPLSWKSAVICQWNAINYRNKPYIAEKRMLSAVRSNFNCFDGANGWRVMVTWIQLGFNVSVPTQPVLKGLSNRKQDGATRHSVMYLNTNDGLWGGCLGNTCSQSTTK